MAYPNQGTYYGQGIGNLAGAYMLGNTSYANPADSAMGYLNQIPGTISPYYQPYINAGTGALNTLTGQYTNLINNPTQTMNQIGGTYQASPGYQWQVDQATSAANNAAAAGGMAGSPAEQQQLATTTNQLANQDYWNYVNHGMQQYNTGLSGEQDINHMGYQASNELAQSLANALMSQAKLSYAGTANQNMMKQGTQGAQDSMGINGLADLGTAWFMM